MCYDLEYKALLGWQLNSIVICREKLRRSDSLVEYIEIKVPLERRRCERTPTIVKSFAPTALFFLVK